MIFKGKTTFYRMLYPRKPCTDFPEYRETIMLKTEHGKGRRLQPVLFALIALSVLSSHAAKAQDDAMDNGRTIVLSAPEPVRELLKTHLEIPEGTLTDETARATFMRRARQEIGALLATEGYFTPMVQLHPAGPDGKWKLEVEPGPLTRVTNLDITFTGEMASDGSKERELRIGRLISAWKLAIGAPFRSQAWEDAKVALLASTSREDYAAAHITASQAEIDPSTASARLKVVVETGPAFRFGPLALQGLERYSKELVERQKPFQEGEPYRRDLLLQFQARLQNMPQFGSVMVDIETEAATHESAPVRVVVSEAKTRRIAIGVGYSTDNGPRSEVGYMDHNFYDHAWSFDSGLRLEQNRQRLTAVIDTQPGDNGYRLAWGASTEATLIAGLKTDTHKLNVTRSRMQDAIETRLGLHWQQENRKAAGGIQEINQAMVLDWQWLRRVVDDPLYPKKGNATEIRIGGASRQLLSDHEFLRSYIRSQNWWPLAEHDNLSVRGEMGYTAAATRLGVPQDYLFRAGGSQSVRGYAYQSLGVQEGAAKVGGKALVMTSVEYTHWFGGDWGAALFVDTGGVADGLRAIRLSTGYGSGLRWRSPIGPLAMDLAWGQQSKDLQLHFLLAAAF